MLWIKSFHIIFVTSWFAGLFYLPRLFVNHAMAEDRTTQEHLSLMERKLYRFMAPLAALAIGFGLWLWLGFGIGGWWLHFKLALVLGLVAYHLYCGKLMKDFAQGRNRHGHVWYRWFNEIPVILLTGIVLLVELQPQ